MENKIAINTKTQEEYNRVIEIFEKKGWVWNSWRLPTNWLNMWNDYKENTCVDYKNNFRRADINSDIQLWYKIISFQEFLEMEWKEEFVRWERVLMRDYDYEEWEERIYIATIKWAKTPYIVVNNLDEKKFINWEKFSIMAYKQIKKLKPKTELTMQEIADKFWIDIDNLKIKK